MEDELELENRYEDLLLEIYESEGERLTNSDLLEREKTAQSDIRFLLECLIEKELVEYEKKDDAFYLTYEGYERINMMVNWTEDMIEAEYQHSLKQEQLKRKQRIFSVILGLMVFVGGYFILNGISNNHDLKDVLDKSNLDKIKKDIESKIDSINKSNSIEIFKDSSNRSD